MAKIMETILKVDGYVTLVAFIIMCCNAWLMYIPGVRWIAAYAGPVFWRTLISMPVVWCIGKCFRALEGPEDE